MLPLFYFEAEGTNENNWCNLLLYLFFYTLTVLVPPPTETDGETLNESIH